LVYEQQAIWTREWNEEMVELTEGAGAIGGVIGATKPGQAARARELAGDKVFVLSPGYGPGQGGGADGAVEAIVTSVGGVNGIVNNSSGSTKWSWLDKETKQPKPGDSVAYVQETIEATNTDLNAALVRRIGKPLEEILVFPSQLRHTRCECGDADCDGTAEHSGLSRGEANDALADIGRNIGEPGL